ncbi:MAG: adenosine-specific kinase [Candidatus Krumholzibacteria bacterium]|nr:adenosine-specific kinase [Candidatus Krumholzibacteria bacterium]
MELKTVKIEKPAEVNFILGQSHFIKTVEDLHEAAIAGAQGIRFGVAFCEASGDCLIRFSGNDEEMIDLARSNAAAIGAGHSFIIFMKNAFPINILNAIKQVPEVCRIICATANPTEVIVAESKQGRGILGVIDGSKPRGVEDDEGKQWRHDILRKFGYKL